MHGEPISQSLDQIDRLVACEIPAASATAEY